MKKGSLRRMLGIGLSLVLALGLAGCGGTAPSTKETPQGAAQGSSEEKQVKIGIIQIVEHPALDAARQGFLDALKANGYEVDKNLKLEYQNAQNDQSILNSIAQKFASSDLDLILAIATPSAQAMASATDEIPILITAVTDPVEAKLVDSMDKPGGNISGTTDMNPIKEQLELLKKLVPDAKTVGVIYNAAEVNSEVQVRIVKEEAPALGLEIVETTVSSSADVLQAAQSLIGKVNAIYVPTDNMVVSAAQSVVQVANENKIPLISGESSVVDAGGLGTIGINYTNLGAQTGEMALRILDGAKPADMPVEGQKNFDIVLNQEAIDLLGIEVPADIKSKATIK
ncbi:ABC transporter substrate-binding protein [Desulfitobacterium chlororespirans]|uniref:Putative ABC transport system substrate-binding protein n=1 Tax=Desulfitobacterium chlororespirans DSM 11544 TaxID=1121395 RepID=A0A1M7SBF5_9FIRM|nr:ABC transporter substrate-binding protein [Desulfitobacterium chlororespirans]SHN55778.1 putative ABC transport system substrate-binding protein [Desulfitobacterium chlororespirans DSM 11544]